METGAEIRKVMMMSVRKCYRLVCNHPFLLGFLCFLFFLSRYFPVLFSLLVSASPILVCTAVLLGMLLSFGEPHLPEIEKEERVSGELSALKTGVLGNSTVVVSRDESTVAEKVMGGDKRNTIERAIERVISSNIEAMRLGKEDGLLEVESDPLINDDRSFKAQGGDEKLEYEEVDEKEDEDDEEKGGHLGDGEVGEHRYSLIEEEEDDVQAENSELKTELIDAHVESLVSSNMSGKNKEVEDERKEDEGHEDDEEEEDDEESLDSESDRAESSSPDASMADILPMLDELHPLLDVADTQAKNISCRGSDVASEHSYKSENGNVESDEDSENLERDDGENKNDEEEEEEEDEEEEQSQVGEKGDNSRSVITWTEDDQKNLMDLGTSELERNQRLESLIARRKARRMMIEKNLIDFSGVDLPFNVPSIATTRRNPFDGPDDSYSNMGLPPIPGSAPSILLPRRNPFDLPYEPDEEKPDLKEDSFQQEFISSSPMQPPRCHNQQRDNFFFRRHESFSVGPSSLGLSRQERQELKWKPYFVPEHSGSEVTSFRSFERQSSGMSESKASSVPDTESVTSTVDHEGRINEPEEFLHETEEMSNVDRVSLLVEHGSVASEDLDHRDIDEEEGKRNARHNEVEITLGDAEAETESLHDDRSSLFEEGNGANGFASPSDVNTNGFEVKTEQVAAEDVDEEEEKENIHSSKSGSSSSSIFSEVDEKILEVKKESGEASSSQIDNPEEESRPQDEHTEFSFMTDHHKEPVYDSRPAAVEKHLSFSSDSSDLTLNRESEVLSENMQNDDHDNENIARNSDVTEIREDNFHRDGFSETEEVLADQNNVSSSPSSGIESVGNDLLNDSYLHHEHSGTEPSNLSSVITELAMDTEQPFQSGQTGIITPLHEISWDDIVPSNHNLVQHEEDHGTKMDIDVQFHDTVQRMDTPASSHWHMLSDLSGGLPHGAKRVIPVDWSAPLEEVSEIAEEQLCSVIKPSSDKTNEEPEPSVESAIANLNEGSKETHDDGGKDSVVVSTLTSKSPSFSSASSNYESPTVGPGSRDHTAGGTEFGILHRQISEYCDPSADVIGSLSMDKASSEGGDDEIRDFDEGFLAELDTVGDFRVEETGYESQHPEFVHEEEIGGGLFESGSLNRSESGLDLPVLEARSPEDITMAFRQLEEGADVEEVILPSSIDDGVKILEGTESGLPVILARSLDDIHVVKQTVEDNLEKLPEKTEVKSHDVADSFSKEAIDIDEPNDSNNATQGSSNLPVLEVRSVEDVTMAFMQLDEGAEVNEVILPSSIKDQEDSRVLEGTSSGMPVVEVRSLDGFHNVWKQVMEDNLEEVPKETDEKSHNTEEFASTRTSDIDELRDSNNSTQDSSNMPVLEVRSVEDITTAFMQLNEGAEVEEVILPSSIKDLQELMSSDGTSSGLPVVEVRSLDVIHNVVKQAMEENHEEVPDEIMLSRDPSVEAEVTQQVKEVNSEAIVTEPEVQETAVAYLSGPKDAEVSTSKSPDFD